MNVIRQKLKNIPFLGQTIRTLHYAATAGWTRDPAHLIGKDIKEKKAFVLQIGSNDGISGDPIFKLMQRRPDWEGLFVEPVPYLFQRLKDNYGDSPRFRFINSAVNDGSSQMFYWVDQHAKDEIPGLPEWWEQIGSFRKGYIQEILGPNISGHVRETLIKGITLQELMAKYSVASVDVLHVDTEGYEWKILRQLEGIPLRPRIILFEHKHLSAAEKNEALNVLSLRYRIYDLGVDFYCKATGDNIQDEV